MDRESFVAFVAQAVREAISLAAEELRMQVPDRAYLRWWPGAEIITNHVAEAITVKVYLSESSIRPCVDLGVIDIAADGTPIVAALVAGHPPRPFGINWRGTAGPFVYILALELLSGRRPRPDKSLAFKYLLPVQELGQRG